MEHSLPAQQYASIFPQWIFEELITERKQPEARFTSYYELMTSLEAVCWDAKHRAPTYSHKWGSGDRIMVSQDCRYTWCGGTETTRYNHSFWRGLNVSTWFPELINDAIIIPSDKV